MVVVCFIGIGAAKAIDIEEPLWPDPEPDSVQIVDMGGNDILPTDIVGQPIDVRNVIEPGSTVGFIEGEMPSSPSEPVVIGLYPTFEIGVPTPSESK